MPLSLEIHTLYNFLTSVFRILPVTFSRGVFAALLINNQWIFTAMHLYRLAKKINWL